MPEVRPIERLEPGADRVGRGEGVVKPDRCSLSSAERPQRADHHAVGVQLVMPEGVGVFTTWLAIGHLGEAVDMFAPFRALRGRKRSIEVLAENDAGQGDVAGGVEITAGARPGAIGAVKAALIPPAFKKLEQIVTDFRQRERAARVAGRSRLRRQHAHGAGNEGGCRQTTNEIASFHGEGWGWREMSMRTGPAGTWLRSPLPHQKRLHVKVRGSVRYSVYYRR